MALVVGRLARGFPSSLPFEKDLTSNLEGLPHHMCYLQKDLNNLH